MDALRRTGVTALRMCGEALGMAAVLALGVGLLDGLVLRLLQALGVCS